VAVAKPFHVNLKSLCFGGSAIDGFFSNLALAVLRGFAGVSLLIVHGWDKIPVSSSFVEAIGHLGFPVPVVFAWLAALTEVIGGSLVALGLVTRPAALCVAVNMAVAGFMGSAGSSLAQRELPLLYGAVFLLFTVVGAGRLSFDAGLRGGS
jgi:putative oxidoreductase